MNKITQNTFQWIYPFYPLWAWVSLSFFHIPADKILIFVVLPFLIHIIWYIRIRIPVYLIFLFLFAVYHLSSIYYHELLPGNTNWLFYTISDSNVLAFVLLLVIENTDFDDAFIEKMNRHILWIVVLSFIVSVIQIKSPFFFYNVSIDDELSTTGENRNASIYSWISSNTIGISFPILISILLCSYDTGTRVFPIITIAGLAVAFLSKARYVMISTMIVFLQLFLVKTIALKKKLYVVLFLLGGIGVFLVVAQMVGFDINKTINERILEKDSDMASAKSRVLSYEVFKMKFPENGYFGVGPKTRPDVVDLLNGEAPIIHVGYLSYLYFYGFFGASLIFIALIFLLRDAWLIGRRENFWGAFYGLLGFALANATLVYFNFSEMGIILAVIYMRYYKVNSLRFKADSINSNKTG